MIPGAVIPGAVIPGAVIPGALPRRAAKPKWELSDHWPTVIILGGGALLAMAMCCGIGSWLLMPPAAKKAGPPPAALNKAAPDTPISRTAQAGPRSWVPAHYLKAADKGAWKVTAEPIEVPTDLVSAVFIPDQARATVAFSGPASARAGVLQTVANPETSRYALAWTVYDLRQPLPIAKVTTYPEWPTGPSAPLPLAVMSQSGKEIAVAEPYPGEVRVWSDDGKEMCTIMPPEGTWAGNLRRVRFAGSSRLVIDGGEALVAFELPSGKELFRLPAAADKVAVVSRGGNWLAQVTPKAVHWFNAADGSPAGTIDFGEHWKLWIAGEVGMRTPGFALHPNGRSLAILASNAEQDLLVAHWDLARGEPIEQFIVPVAHHGYQIGLDAVWCGERKLLFNTGQVIDLDLKTWTCRYNVSNVGDSPEYRRWGLASLNAEQTAAAAKKLNIPPPAHGGAVVARTIPDERIAERLAAARQGALFHPGYRFAVEADQTVPPEVRQTVLGALADALATAGCDVDPKAPAKARIVEAATKRVPNMTFDGRKFHHVDVKVEFIGADGRAVLLHQFHGAQGAGRVDDAWVALAAELKAKLELPRLVLKDRAGKDLEPRSELLEPAIDGLFAPGEL